jgi:hypothetical protein
MTPILRRLARRLGPEGMAGLAALPPRDLTSLLLHLFAERAGRLTPLALLEDYERAPACRVSFADPRRSLIVQAAILEAAADFEGLELSPVGPLGAAQVLGGVHQNNVLAATRGLEVLGDPSLALVLEGARRRRDPAARATPLRLCASQRVMRMQPAPPGLLPHFRLYAQITCARRPLDELAELRLHLRVYLAALRALAGRGFCFADPTVEISDTAAVERRLREAGIDRDAVRQKVRTHVGGANEDFGLARLDGEAALAAAGPMGARLAGEVIAPLAAEFPGVTLRLDLSRLEGLGYYRGPCVRINARDVEGRMLPLVDGGFLDWTKTLLSDGRERLLTTGAGVDLICARYFPA